MTEPTMTNTPIGTYIQRPNLLTDALCTYLGTLLYQRDNTHDWIEKDALTEKISAIYVLLDIDDRQPTWMEKAVGQFKITR
jgi:hypothetical protein